MSGQTVTMPEPERVSSPGAGRRSRLEGPERPAGLDDLAEQLVEQARASGIALTGPDGLLSGLTRQVLQTALEAELTEHLGHEHGGVPGPGGLDGAAEHQEQRRTGASPRGTARPFGTGPSRSAASSAS